MPERIYDPATVQANALDAVADPKCTRELMATFYADLIRCAQRYGNDCINSGVINLAIFTRWPKGLEFIKRRAWKLVDAD